MRYFLSVILILAAQALCADSLFYDGWLAFGWKLDVGFLPRYEAGFYRLGDKSMFWIRESPALRQEIGLDAKMWDVWRIFTEISVYETPHTLAAYNPFRADFLIGTEWRWERFTLGLRHRCDHPVEGDVLNERREYHYGGNFTEVYLRISGGYGW